MKGMAESSDLPEASYERERDGGEAVDAEAEAFRTLCVHYSRGCSFVVSPGPMGGNQC